MRKTSKAKTQTQWRRDALRRKFMNEAMFEEMWDSQNGACAICGKGLQRSRLGHAIDHCHNTKRVRGLLCHNCNFILGHAQDDATRLRAAADYLERHAARTDLPVKPPSIRVIPVYEYDGLKLTAKEWAQRSGISVHAVHTRLSQGISLALPRQRSAPRLRHGTGNYTKAMLVRWAKPGAREKQAEHMRAWHAARKAAACSI